MRTFWIAPDSVARNFWNATDRTELRERVQKVGPDSPRRWGKMTSHQMICHLADAFRWNVPSSGSHCIRPVGGRKVTPPLARSTKLPGPALGRSCSLRTETVS